MLREGVPSKLKKFYKGNGASKSMSIKHKHFLNGPILEMCENL